jgi:purine-binding chemotaxis protein CheW
VLHLLTKKYSSQENEITPVSIPYLDDTSSHTNNLLHDDSDKVTEGIQYIGFKLHKEEFLLPMSLVREIIMLTTITFVPQSSTLLEGIVALRGEIMPVLNLRRFLKFVRGKAETTSRVIILDCQYGGFGVIVDDITEFVWLLATEIESIPQNFFPSEYKILLGVSRVGNKIRGIIDLNTIVSELVHEIIEDNPNEPKNEDHH